MEWFVRTADGRTLAVEDAGDRAGRPVLVHVGTPNSRHLYGRTVADATARGLRLISYDRPGYGESTPQRGRADLAFLTDEAACMQQALAAGIEGSWDDCVAQVTPWGFDVARISVPVLLLHGRQDKSVPVGHGEWLAARIPGVDARLLDNEGHGTLRENRIGEVQAWLTERS